MKGKILGIIRVVAGVLILIAGLGKFGGDMSQVGGAAPALLPFLWFLSNTAWGRAAAIWQVLAWAGLILWYKTRLAGLLAAIIMIFAWNVIGWELNPTLLVILLWAIIAAFMWGGDFSLESMLKWSLGKAGAMAGGVAGWLWGIAKGAGNLAGDVVWWAADLAGKAASTTTGAVWSVAKGAADVAGSAVDAAGSVAGGVADAAWSVAGWAADAVKGAGGLIGGLAGWLWDAAGSVIDKWWDMAKGVVTAVADKVDAATGWVASGIIDKVEDMAEDLIEKAEDVVEEVIDVD